MYIFHVAVWLISLCSVKACENGRGAILLSVARGKVSEGIDFGKCSCPYFKTNAVCLYGTTLQTFKIHLAHFFIAHIQHNIDPVLCSPQCTILAEQSSCLECRTFTPRAASSKSEMSLLITIILIGPVLI